MDVEHMSKDQLIDLANESGQNLKNDKSQIASLEADHRLYELSRDNKALTASLEKRAPDIHALFSDLRSNSTDDPSSRDFPSIQELEESIEAILGPVH